MIDLLKISVLPILFIFNITGFSQVSTSENYIKTVDVLVDQQKTDSEVSLLNESDKNQFVQYFDGLGRPIQTINIKGSPLMNDVVTHIEYDEFGREVKQFLPFSISTITPGAYRPFARVDNALFSGFQGEATTFSETKYDDSPLNRIIEQASAGDSWAMATGNTSKFSYEANTSSDKVKQWFIQNGYFKYNQDYAANELYKNITIDEENHHVIQFTNKLGQVILKRTQLAENPDLNNFVSNEWTETYYIHDDYGNQRVVIPPEGVNAIGVPTTPYTLTSSILDTWCFTYEYDSRNRMIEKKIPGSEPKLMVYDTRDRLVLTQDGNLREDSIWAFTKYDELDRSIITGFYYDPSFSSQSQMQITLSNFYGIQGKKLYEERSGTIHDYTNQSFPDDADVLEYLTVSYYDDYLFVTDQNFDFQPVSGVIQNNEIKNLVTGSKTKILGTTDWKQSVIYYDYKYRPIQVIEMNHLGKFTKTENQYGFTGNVVSSSTTYNKNVGDRIIWTDLNFLTIENNGLRKTAGGAVWNAGAASENILITGEDGWIETTIAETNTSRMFGLSDTNTGNDWQSIDYAFYFINDGRFTVREGGSGSNKGGFGNYNSGDVFRIERVNDVIYYKHNGNLFFTSTISSLSDLIIDVSIFHVNATISKPVVSFSANEEMTIERDFDYDHVLRPTKTHHRIKQNTIESTVSWSDVSNATSNGSKLTKTGSAGWNAGAFSVEFIPENEDGWFSYIAENTTSFYMAGISQDNPNNNWNTIDYGFMINQDQFQVRKNGSGILLSGTFEPGDEFSIGRINGTIYYWINNDIVYTLNENSTAALYADVSINGTNDEIDRVEIHSSSWIIIADNQYNELGQLADKKIHSKNAGSNFLQSIDYRYNLRGWLTSINNAGLSINSMNDDSNDLWGMELYFEQVDPGLGNSALYNGNISGVKWSNDLGLGTEKEWGYIYSYDPLNRIQSAQHKKLTTIWTSSNAFKLDNLSYDDNGNIIGLRRTDKNNIEFDDLSYQYSGNQLLSVNDPSLNEAGFRDGNSSGDDYSYDANGNLIEDKNKDINAIQYNFLNLPELVTKEDGNTIEFIYDAAGNKLTQIVNDETIDLSKSDFSSNTDGWLGALATLVPNQDNIFGKDGVLKAYAKANAGNHAVYQFSEFTYDANEPNKTIRLTAEIYIPSANTNVDGVQLNIGTSNDPFIMNTTDQWVEVSYETVANNSALRIYMANGSSISYSGAGNSSDDIVYIKNIIVEEVDYNRTQRTDYIGEIISTSDSTHIIQHEEGRIVVGYGDKANINKFKYQYHLNDHLGNVRMTIQEKDTMVYIATMEDVPGATRMLEDEEFENIYETEDESIPVLNHTAATQDNPSPRWTAKLNGVEAIIGPAKRIMVVPGDKIEAETYVKYLDQTSYSNTVPFNTVASNLGNTFAFSAGEASSILAGSFNSAFTAFGAYGGTETDRPRAFLNYVLFDLDHNYVDMGAVRIGTSGMFTIGNPSLGVHEQLSFSSPIEVKEAGYIYIYVSNETINSEVYFDDIKITHYQSEIVQKDDYYPFGFSFAEYQRQDEVKNKFLFNSGSEREDQLLLIDFTKLRTLDPSIGRWWQIDPLADITQQNAMSPYNFGWNNPISYNDPNGDCPCIALPLFYSILEGLIYAGAVTSTIYALNEHTEINPFEHHIFNDGTIPNHSNAGGSPNNINSRAFMYAAITAFISVLIEKNAPHFGYSEFTKEDLFAALDNYSDQELSQIYNFLMRRGMNGLTWRQLFLSLNPDLADSDLMWRHYWKDVINLERGLTDEEKAAEAEEAKKAKKASEFLQNLDAHAPGIYIWDGENWVQDTGDKD